MATDDTKCILFPKPYEEPFCKAGSDVSGEASKRCTDEYSEQCLWFALWEKEDKLEEELSQLKKGI